MGLRNVIITVPHAFCEFPYSTVEHWCDGLSEKAARMLNRHLRDQSQLLIGNTSRRICDLNRIHCRNSPYRDLLRRIVSTTADLSPIVLDIHSFPDDVEHFLNMEVVILEEEGVTITSSLISRLYSFLIDNGVKIAVLPGVINDILDEMNELGVHAILLEFNESLSKERLNRITGLIASWIKLI